MLADITARYGAAAEVAVELHELEWPAMQEAVRQLRRLRVAADAGVSIALEQLLSTARQWVLTLAGSPLAGSDPQTGTASFSGALQAHEQGNLDSHLDAELRALVTVVEEIAGMGHPAADCLGDIISRYGRERPEDPPAVYLAARDDSEAALVRSWLQGEELDAEVLRLTTLKHADVRQALVLLGPPARYRVSQWCDLDRAGRLAGWLVTAPPAPAVHVVTWPGHPRFDPGAAALLPTTKPPQVSVTRRSNPSGPSLEPAWLPPPAVRVNVATNPRWEADRDPVEARAVLLAGDKLSLFGNEGPQPEKVTWELNAVDIAEVPVRRLAVGSALLFRPNCSATGEELHRRAEELLRTKHGSSAPVEAERAKAELKDALRNSPKPLDQLHYELASRLNNSPYARHILRSIPIPDYIAPEKAGAYAAVRHILGMRSDVDGAEYALLRALRQACRSAGVEITRDLIEALRTTSAWQVDVEAMGWATVTAGPLLGQLHINVVVGLDDAPRRVGRTRLGRLLDPSASTGGAHTEVPA